MSRKTIQFGDVQTEYIALAVKQRGYRSDSEYIRDLVRRDEEKNREFLALRAELQNGIDSGISDRTFDEIWEDGRQEALGQRAKENA